MIPDISVVIPAHNEEQSIPSLVSALNRFIESIDYSIQLVFVDDGSTDNTLQVLMGSSIDHADVRIVKLSKNYGAHPAIRAGILHAEADYVVVYSVDMPEPVEDITMMYRELLAGNEIVYSERKGYKGGLGSRLFAWMITRFIEKNYPTDGLIGVAFGPKVKRELNRNIESSSSIFFQLFQLGFKKKGIQVEYNEREHGTSKWTFSKKLKLLVDSFVMFSFTPIRVITGMGILMSLVGFIWAVCILVIKIFDLFELAAGWPTTISILLIGFGMTNLSLGIIAEYLVRTLEISSKRPAFIVDELIEQRKPQV